MLTRAIRDGINPYTTIYGSRRLNFDDPEYGPIDVKTYSDTLPRARSRSPSATLSSDNTVFQQLTLDVGPKNVIDTAYEMGVSQEPPPARTCASIGLGAGEVTPLDMATAYAPLSNGGYRVTPQAISQDHHPGRQEEVFAPRADRGSSPTASPTR